VQEPVFSELQTLAAADMFAEMETADRAVKHRLKEMVAEDKVLIMSDEEERMIRSLRRFKATCKPGAVFKWQTRPTEGITIHAGNAPALVYDPQEVA
jgi:hypothetical protein